MVRCTAAAAALSKGSASHSEQDKPWVGNAAGITVCVREKHRMCVYIYEM